MSEEETSEYAEDDHNEDSYNLYIFPNIAGGETVERVKAKLATTLKVDKHKVDAWYESETPTVLLKGVARETAERYMTAIQQCGASCDIQASKDTGGLTLVPKSKNIDFFICPSCEYEEEVPQGTKYEQCPKCGLVIAKWEEKMKEEREKDAIRRRLMRDARLDDDREADLDKKRAELERLRNLEREIMKELGIKPPGAFRVFFDRHPFSVSSAAGVLLITLSSVVHFYIDGYLDGQRQEDLAAEAPSEEIQQIAPVVAAAIQLQQSGNETAIAEMAQAAAVMRGETGDTTGAIVEAAQQMMKGADVAQFMAAAAPPPAVVTATMPGPANQSSVPVNVDTLGGVSGIPGVDHFSPGTLQEIAPPMMERGHEGVLSVLAEKRLIPDPTNPDISIMVDELDKMDGSKIVDLLGTLDKDQEWDQFMARNVDEFLLQGNIDAASSLADRIESAVIKIDALGHVMAQMYIQDPKSSLKLLMARVRIVLEEIPDQDTKAKVLLEFGARLAIAGYDGEPGASMDYVEQAIRDATDPYVKSTLSARLALAQLMAGNKARAREQFAHALDYAGQIKSPVQRISAFTRIAQRYYDARNPTLANKILSEAQVLAATMLTAEARSRIFGEIAIAQGYLGDLTGAMISIRNASVGAGQQQLFARLAGSLIALDRHYEAQAIMDELTDDLEFCRLQIRLISGLIHVGKTQSAKMLLADAGIRARRIASPGERGLIQSQFGRLAVRSGLRPEGERFFAEALANSTSLKGRKAAVNRGLVGLDQVRALMIDQGRDTMSEVKESIVKDPIDSEILVTIRVLRDLMPESVKAQLEPETKA